jgi:hypothetical protein
MQIYEVTPHNDKRGVNLVSMCCHLLYAREIIRDFVTIWTTIDPISNLALRAVLTAAMHRTERFAKHIAKYRKQDCHPECSTQTSTRATSQRVEAQYAGLHPRKGGQIDRHLCFATVSQRLVRSEMEPVTTR